MQAIAYTRYGSPEVLQLRNDVETPRPGEKEILVRVRAATVNRTDCATIAAKPWFMRFFTGFFHPKKEIPGTEFAGEVAETSPGVTLFKKGDRVFGFDDMGTCAQAQYLAVSQEKALAIPEGFSFLQAAPAFEGAYYALNFLNKVPLTQGQKVLVNGATGAIGSAAVQLLTAYDVEITAVCAGEHEALVRSLGAHRTIDFTKDDGRYDYVFDAVGKSTFFRCRKLLKPGGAYISSDLGPMAQNLYLPLLTPLLKLFFRGKRPIFPNPYNLPGCMKRLRERMEAGSYRPLIDRSYPLEQIGEAYRYAASGRKIGNVVVTVE